MTRKVSPKFMMRLFVLLLGLCVVVCIQMMLSLAEDGTKQKYVTVVLVGATGDLSKKYLWQGLFDLYTSESAKGYIFSFIGCTRSPPTEKIVLETEIKNRVKCLDGSLQCELKSKFLSVVYYQQLKAEEHYKSLNVLISDLFLKHDNVVEHGRIFYLAIPPFAYPATAQNLHHYCHPENKNVWTRLVIEKPFGSDLETAQNLVKDLSKYYSETELFAVDHYLAKSVVQGILPFRRANIQFENMLSRDHVQRVEVAMLETIDVKDRFSFYNEYGVIRDVVQNHLMELMTLTAMELPNSVDDISDIHAEKKQLLRQIRPFHANSFIVGQYNTYSQEAREYLREDSLVTSVPTYTAVLLNIDSLQWKDVPFILISGKKLPLRHSYIKIVFKNNLFSFSDTKCAENGEIIFNIGNGKLGHPGIIISKLLPLKFPKEHWNYLKSEGFDCYNILSPKINKNAYSHVIESVFHNRRQDFINLDHMVDSWRLWTPLLSKADKASPRLYKQDNHNGLQGDLDFVYNASGIYFTKPFIYRNANSHVYTDMENQGFAHISATYRNNKLVSGSRWDTLQQLALDIQKAAYSVLVNNSVFHLALSGGNSAIGLFQALRSLSAFPWKQTHIWQVDERCVSHDNEASNFRSLDENLLRYIPIPHTQVHPMPVQLMSGICHPSDQGDTFYETTIQRLVKDSQMDFVVLGVGEDGHTASLFPLQKILKSEKELVQLTNKNSKSLIKDRMSVTFNLLNKSKNIAVLAFGKNKHSILNELNSNVKDITQHPITGVDPVDGSLVWYIDHDAYFGRG